MWITQCTCKWVQMSDFKIDSKYLQTLKMPTKRLKMSAHHWELSVHSTPTHSRNCFYIEMPQQQVCWHHPHMQTGSHELVWMSVLILKFPLVMSWVVHERWSLPPPQLRVKTKTQKSTWICWHLHKDKLAIASTAISLLFCLWKLRHGQL